MFINDMYFTDINLESYQWAATRSVRSEILDISLIGVMSYDGSMGAISLEWSMPFMTICRI